MLSGRIRPTDFIYLYFQSDDDASVENSIQTLFSLRRQSLVLLCERPLNRTEIVFFFHS